MATLFGFILVVAGSLWLAYALSVLRDGRRSEGWRRTTGTILESRVVHPVSGRTNPWTPRIRYRYEVRGRSFESDRTQAGPVWTLPWTARRKVEQYHG